MLNPDKEKNICNVINYFKRINIETFTRDLQEKYSSKYILSQKKYISIEIKKLKHITIKKASVRNAS